MTTQYITVAQVKERMPSSYTGTDDTALGDILTSCCAFLDNYCGVANGGFAVQTYDELYNGTGDQILFLRNRPVQTITKVACTELPALLVHNTSTDTGCRATVAVSGSPGNAFNLNSQYTSTGITLTYVASGVTTTNTLTWASYPTVAQLATAVNGLGNNWTATVQGGFGTWSTSDLRATQGAFGARITTTYLWIHWMDLPWYRINEETGEVFNPGGFTRGSFNWRVVYSAGYSAFPDDLTQALAELCVATWYQKSVNPALQSESLGQYSYTRAAKVGFDSLSGVAQKTLGRYRRHTVSKFSAW